MPVPCFFSLRYPGCSSVASARSACRPRRSLNTPKRPQRPTLLYRRRRLDSLNPCSISFSDQIPTEGRADKCRGAFCDGCDRPGLVGISRRDRGPIALGLYTAAPAREGGSDRLREQVFGQSRLAGRGAPWADGRPDLPGLGAPLLRAAERREAGGVIRGGEIVQKGLDFAWERSVSGSAPWSTKGSLRILPRRLYRLCGASVVAAQDAASTEQRISTMSLKKLSSNERSLGRHLRRSAAIFGPKWFTQRRTVS